MRQKSLRLLLSVVSSVSVTGGLMATPAVVTSAQAATYSQHYPNLVSPTPLFPDDEVLPQSLSRTNTKVSIASKHGSVWVPDGEFISTLDPQGTHSAYVRRLDDSGKAYFGIGAVKLDPKVYTSLGLSDKTVDAAKIVSDDDTKYLHIPNAPLGSGLINFGDIASVGVTTTTPGTHTVKIYVHLRESSSWLLVTSFDRITTSPTQELFSMKVAPSEFLPIVEDISLVSGSVGSLIGTHVNLPDEAELLSRSDAPQGSLHGGQIPLFNYLSITPTKDTPQAIRRALSLSTSNTLVDTLTVRCVADKSLTSSDYCKPNSKTIKLKKPFASGGDASKGMEVYVGGLNREDFAMFGNGLDLNVPYENRVYYELPVKNNHIGGDLFAVHGMTVYNVSLQHENKSVHGQEASKYTLKVPNDPFSGNDKGYRCSFASTTSSDTHLTMKLSSDCNATVALNKRTPLRFYSDTKKLVFHTDDVVVNYDPVHNYGQSKVNTPVKTPVEFDVSDKLATIYPSSYGDSSWSVRSGSTSKTQAAKPSSASNVTSMHYDSSRHDTVVDNVAPVTYSLESAPSWLSIDSSTGELTAKPTSNDVGSHTASVIAHWVDGSTQKISRSINVSLPPRRVTIADTTTPEASFSSKVSAGESSHATITGVPWADFDVLPNSPSWVSVDQTGVITAAPPSSTKAGTYTAHIQITYADHSTDFIDVPMTVTSLLTTADSTTPTYSHLDSIRAGESSRTTISGVPAGSRFSVNSESPSWVSVDSKGVVTISPTKNTSPGHYNAYVTVTYPDGSHDVVEIQTLISPKALTQADKHKPAVSALPTVAQHGSTKVAINGVPSDARCTLVSGGYSWLTLNEDCSLTVSPTWDTKPATYTPRVTVTYADGSQDTITIPVTVSAGKDSDHYAHPNVSNFSVGQGGTVSTTITGVPSGSRGSVDSHRYPWVSVKNTGSSIVVSAQPDKNAPTGSTTVPITVTYPDGSQRTVSTTITVASTPRNAVYSPRFTGSHTVKQSEKATIAAPSGNEPGATCAKTPETPGWVSVNPDCSLTVSPTFNDAVGAVDVPIQVTFSDHTTKIVSVRVTVSAGPEAKRDPSAVTPVSVSVTQGEKNTFKVVSDLPEGATCRWEASSVPSWVHTDGCTVTVTPGIDDAYGQYSLTGSIVYKDGSTKPLTAMVTALKAPQSVSTRPTWSTKTVPSQGVVPGTPVTLPAPVDHQGHPLPTGTLCQAGEGMPAWATVNPDCSITVNPPYGTPVGSIDLPVSVTYPDQSTGSASVSVTIDRVKDADHFKPSWSDAKGVPVTVVAGKGPQTVVAQSDVPQDAQCTRTDQTPAWATINPDCSITVDPDWTTVGVTPIELNVRFGDGTSKVYTANINVADSSDASKPPATNIWSGTGVGSTDTAPVSFVAGGTATISGPDAATILEGTTFGACDPDKTPSWVHIDPATGAVSLTPQSGDEGDYTIGLCMVNGDKRSEHSLFVHVEAYADGGNTVKAPGDDAAGSSSGSQSSSTSSDSSPSGLGIFAAIASLALAIGVIGGVMTGSIPLPPGITIPGVPVDIHTLLPMLPR